MENLTNRPAQFSLMQIIAIIGLVLTIGGVVANNERRLSRLESAIEDAQLNGMKHDLQEVRDNVDWLRKEWERQRERTR